MRLIMIYENITSKGHRYWRRLWGKSSSKLIPVELIDGHWRQTGNCTANYCRYKFKFHCVS